MRKMMFAGLALAGLALSACADGPPYGPRPSHVQRCANRHPGYDPRTNLFPGPDGRLHECRAGGY